MPLFSPSGGVTLTYSRVPGEFGRSGERNSLSEEDQLPLNEEGEGFFDAAFCQHAQEVACTCARRYGFREEDAQETAVGFVEHILQHKASFLRYGLQGRVLEAWLYRCAHNWIINAYRGRKRLRQREITIAELKLGGQDPRLQRLPTPEPSLEALLLREELCRRVREVVLHLSPGQQALYVAYYEEQHSVAELALASNRTANAVRFALWALRRRMQHLLEQIGLDEPEIQEYRHLISLWQAPNTLRGSGVRHL